MLHPFTTNTALTALLGLIGLGVTVNNVAAINAIIVLYVVLSNVLV
jgi:hypothetical protein